MAANPLDERIKKAFDFYADATKQLITLSTGIIALMITFAKEILKTLSGPAKIPLMAALIVYLVSILFGSGTLLNLTGQLEPYNKEKVPEDEWTPETWPRPSIHDSRVNRYSKLQIVLFLFATSLIVLSALLSAFRS